MLPAKSLGDLCWDRARFDEGYGLGCARSCQDLCFSQVGAAVLDIHGAVRCGDSVGWGLGFEQDVGSRTVAVWIQNDDLENYLYAQDFI